MKLACDPVASVMRRLGADHPWEAIHSGTRAAAVVGRVFQGSNLHGGGEAKGGTSRDWDWVEWEMMTVAAAKEPPPDRTRKDQEIEKFSCNRHVLVTLFKTFTVAPSRTEKVPWQGLLTRLRGVGCRVLSR